MSPMGGGGGGREEFINMEAYIVPETSSVPNTHVPM